jgi:hypothetical protein
MYSISIFPRMNCAYNYRRGDKSRLLLDEIGSLNLFIGKKNMDTAFQFEVAKTLKQVPDSRAVEPVIFCGDSAG